MNLFCSLVHSSDEVTETCLEMNVIHEMGLGLLSTPVEFDLTKSLSVYQIECITTKVAGDQLTLVYYSWWECANGVRNLTFYLSIIY